MDPCAANEPPAETIAMEEEGDLAGGPRFTGRAGINGLIVRIGRTD